MHGEVIVREGRVEGLGQPDGGAQPSSDTYILVILTTAVRYWRILVGLPGIGIAIGLVVGLLLPKEFDAESRFAPNSMESSASRLASVSAQLGLASVGGGQGPDFYAEVLKSRDLLEKLAWSEFEVPVDGGVEGERAQRTLIEHYSQDDNPDEKEIRKILGRLSDQIAVRVHGRSGMITLTTTSYSPDLAVQINQRMLDLFQEFNLDRRQDRGRAEREFIEERLERAREELKEAEGELERFLDENRYFHSAPRLTIESSRLQQKVALQQQMYVGLVQLYEQARVEELRNTPIVTIFDAPKYAGSRSKRRTILFMILGMAMGGLLAVVRVFATEYWEWLRYADRDRYRQFVAALGGGADPE